MWKPALLLLFLLALVPAAAAAEAPPGPARATFAFSLKDAAPLTSAGVFDAQGRLVKQLWAMKPLPAGEQKGEWDGLDEFGQPAAGSSTSSARTASTTASSGTGWTTATSARPRAR